MSDNNTISGTNDKRFPQRLEFYYQSIAIYSIVLLVYSLLRGTIREGELTLELIDPISILLVVFIIGTALTMLFDLLKRREIIIQDDSLVFKSGKKEKRYQISDIEKILIRQDKTFHFRSNHKTALIKVKNRKRAIRIRFSSYHNDKELFEAIIAFRENL